MKKYLKKWIAVACVLCMALSLAACGKSNSSAGGSGKTKVLVAFSSGGDAFRELLMAGVESALKEQKVDYDLVLADDSVEKQIEQIKSAEKDGYTAIICRLVDSNTAAQVERAAGNLPIVYLNAQPTDKFLEADKYIYVGSEEAVAGRYQAEYVLEQLKSKDTINVMFLKGEAGHSATTGRTSAAKETLEASGKKINYIFEDNADWSTDLAKQYFELFYRTGQMPDAVICNNDSMALGIEEAFKTCGIDPKDVIVTGVDAIADGCKSIKAGEMNFTVCQNATNQAAAAVDVAILLAKGESIASYDKTADNGYQVWVDYEKVDASNVGDYM